MNVFRSRDGTGIAFDRLGGSLPIVLVGGPFGYRTFPELRQLAEYLAARFTVVNYDRRGRGDSGDTAPYAVEREIEDLEAVIDAVGGAARVGGWSSGGLLALRAAAAGVRIERLAVYDPPFIVEGSGHPVPADLAAQLHELTSAGRRSAAVRLFMTKAMGVPPLVVGFMRCSPSWSRFREAARAIADVLPDARHRVLARQSRNVSMPVLAPVLEEFFGRPAQARRLPSSSAWAATPAA